MTQLSYVQVEHPIGGLSQDEIAAKFDAAYPDIVAALTTWKADPNVRLEQAPPYPAKHMKATGTAEDINKTFTGRKWTVGLPIVPPAADQVAELLKNAGRAPEEVLWSVPPRRGMLTVELTAALGVMAGCKAEQMPLLVAAVEAMKNGQPIADAGDSAANDALKHFAGLVTTILGGAPVTL